MHQPETPPPQPLQVARRESSPPMPPPLHMETAPPQPPLPPPPTLQKGTEIEPQQVPMQIPPPESLLHPPPPLEHDQQEPPLQTLPLPPAMQNTTSSVTPTPASPGRRPAGESPVLAAINPTRNSGPVKWSTGLCGCHNDFHNCFITCCCPCVTFGQISEIIDRGSSSCVMNGLIYGLLLALLGCACLYSCTYRERLRRQFNLEGNACGGCCTHFCCELCALCQEYRELKSRGFDLSKGWDAQMELRTQGVMLAPTTDTGMNR